MLLWECSVLSVTLIWGKKAYRDTEKQNSIKHRKKYIRFDNQESIYTVVKSQRGVRYPFHLQKSFYGENAPKIICENQCCMNFIEMYQASWLKNDFCNHLKTVIADQPLFPEPVFSSGDTIGKTGVLKYSRTAWYKELNETVSLRNKNAVVSFDDHQYNHLSRKQTCARKATPIWFFQQNKM